MPHLTVSDTAGEIEYEGRDSSRIVERTLLQLARIIRDADGEVRCEVSGDVDQLSFEFFRIRDGGQGMAGDGCGRPLVVVSRRHPLHLNVLLMTFRVNGNTKSMRIEYTRE